MIFSRSLSDGGRQGAPLERLQLNQYFPFGHPRAAGNTPDPLRRQDQAKWLAGRVMVEIRVGVNGFAEGSYCFETTFKNPSVGHQLGGGLRFGSPA
jgi:hypothetical protein